MNLLLLALDVDLSLQRGESVHVRELSGHLAGLGHSVRLVTASRFDPEIPRVVHVSRRRATLAQVAQAVGLSRSWADIVYERRISPKVSWMVSKVTGIPFVIEANGILEDEILGRRASARVGPASFRAQLRNRMLRASHRVVAVSRGVRDDLVLRSQISSERIDVVPNGANTAIFRPIDRDRCRAELSISPSALVACFVGNVVAWQGVDILVRAVASLKSEVPDLLTFVVGHGSDMNAFRSLAEDLGVADRVRFPGSVPYRDVPRFLNSADVCVAPFRKSRKASPIKVFEYLACAKPAVTSDVDDIGEFVKSSGGGLVVKPEDVGALAETIRWVLLHPEDARAMGRSGRAAVLARRSWLATATRVSEILDSACRTRTAS